MKVVVRVEVAVAMVRGLVAGLRHKGVGNVPYRERELVEAWCGAYEATLGRVS